MAKKPDNPMAPIDARAKVFAAAYAALEQGIAQVNTAIEAIRTQYGPELQVLVGHLTTAKAALTDEIERNRNLFEKPRTRTLHGIRLGLMKQRGKITWDCEEEVLIARMVSILGDDEAYQAINITEKVDKTALRELDEKILKKLGVECQGDVDAVFVEPAKGDAEKAVEAFLSPDDAKAKKGKKKGKP